MLPLLACLVVGSVLAVGGVHLPILAVLAVLAALAAMFATRLADVRFPAPAWLALALGAYTVLQAIPMPMGALRVLATANAEVWEHALGPLGEAPPRWAPLSLDPGASLVEALKWFTYALTVYAASALCSRRGPQTGLAIVSASALVAAVTTLSHGLVGAERVFGVYTPTFRPAPWHVGPLLNPNNLAGYLNLGVVCALGLLLTRRPIIPRWLLAIGVACVVAISISAASRGGVAALPIGIVALALMLRGRRLPGNKLVWIVATAVAGGAVFAALATSPETTGEVWEKNTEKLTLLKHVIPMVRTHPWLGIGRGAFESVFPAFRNAPGNVVYTHAENFLAEWAAGWGLPVATAALGAGLWMFRPHLWGRHPSALVAAGWAGLLTLVVQNLFDLGFEVPAVGIGAAVVFGSIHGARTRQAPVRDHARPPAVSTNRVVFALSAVSALVAVSACAFGRRDVATERRVLHAKLRDATVNAASRAEFYTELRGAMLRHPAEPYFPLLGGMLSAAARDRNPMPWLARALERELTNSRAHLVLADVLAARGAVLQALMELRLTVEDDPSLIDVAVRRATRWSQTCDDLLRAVPEGPSGAEVLSGLAAASSRPGCGEKLARTALARSPGSPGPHVFLGGLLAKLLAAPGDARCSGPQRPSCEAEVEEHARAIEAARPRWFEATRLRAEVLRARGQSSEAATLLASKCYAVDERRECLKQRLVAAASTDSPTGLEPAIGDFLASACGQPFDCAEAATAVGDLLAVRNDWGRAVTQYQRAAQEDANETRWLKLADASSRAGAHVGAAEALAKVAKLRGGADQALEERIARERDLALGSPK